MGLDMSIYKQKIGSKKKTEVAYWRKFNALHGWFVDNIQGGNDDCGMYLLNEENLRSLLNTLVQVSDKRDQSLMPPRSGCFFGDTVDKDVYFDKLERSIPVLEDLIFNTDWQKEQLYYSSCW